MLPAFFGIGPLELIALVGFIAVAAVVGVLVWFFTRDSSRDDREEDRHETSGD